MEQFFLIIHVLAALTLIGLVLLQQGRGADAGAAFGSGSSGSLFGARGPTSFLSRITAILAAVFFLTSLSLAYIVSHSDRGESVIGKLGSDKTQSIGKEEISIPPAPSGSPSDSAQAENAVRLSGSEPESASSKTSNLNVPPAPVQTGSAPNGDSISKEAMPKKDGDKPPEAGRESVDPGNSAQ
jgi:preprotein translocase subunit SecG